MKPDEQKKQNSAPTRNPFGVMDVPNPNGQDVVDFAATVALKGSAEDANAQAWDSSRSGKKHSSIEGAWSSRWNGEGYDWKQGEGELKMVEDRVYILFDWDDDGIKKGLIDARREGNNRLVGKYLNLGNPTITRPWVGLIVDNRRIDGHHSRGRIDFRR